MASSLPPLTSWHDEGFASAPVEIPTATGDEIIYRAYGGSSRMLGNCFFMPKPAAPPFSAWTAELLELELNAAPWGNDFLGVTAFKAIRNAAYAVGPIAHDRYLGIDGGRRFLQKSFASPSGHFDQVKFRLQHSQRVESCVAQLYSVVIPAGRYAREASSRAKKYRQ